MYDSTAIFLALEPAIRLKLAPEVEEEVLSKLEII